jgi:16S rRNA (cytidine1402-2'-O)-methyltransferase
MTMQRRSEQDRLAWAQEWAVLSGVAAQDTPAGALYVVATPIGNAADLTLRALWVLSMVDVVAAEDTRTTRQLLERFGLDAPALLAAHEHNERDAAERIVALLQAGQRVALVSDAGTPGVSDPGARIVAAVQAARLRVVPVPGASSVLAAVSAAGLGGHGFQFLGFLPTGAKERARTLAEAAAAGSAFVLLEAPHRVLDTLQLLHATLAPARRVVLARELTKKFEAIEALSAAQLPAFAQAHAPRGEYVLLVDAYEAAAPSGMDAGTRGWLRALAEALPASKAAAVAAKATGLPRDALYAELMRGKNSDGDTVGGNDGRD